MGISVIECCAAKEVSRQYFRPPATRMQQKGKYGSLGGPAIQISFFLIISITLVDMLYRRING